jgi:hypothetical protein
MTMVICYGIFYLFGWHDNSWAAFVILPLGIAGGYGALYFYKIIQETKRKNAS